MRKTLVQPRKNGHEMNAVPKLITSRDKSYRLEFCILSPAELDMLANLVLAFVYQGENAHFCGNKHIV